MRRPLAILIMAQLVWGSACATSATATRAPSAATVPQGTHAVDPWQGILNLEPGTRLQTVLKDGSQFEGRLAFATTGYLSLSGDGASTTQWLRSDVAEIRVHKSGRGLGSGVRAAGRVLGDLFPTGSTTTGDCMCWAPLVVLAAPIIAGGAFVVGALKGDPEWRLLYLAR